MFSDLWTGVSVLNFSYSSDFISDRKKGTQYKGPSLDPWGFSLDTCSSLHSRNFPIMNVILGGKVFCKIVTNSELWVKHSSHLYYGVVTDFTSFTPQILISTWQYKVKQINQTSMSEMESAISNMQNSTSDIIMPTLYLLFSTTLYLTLPWERD